MAQFDVADACYRTRPMCCAEQFALLRKLQPVLPALQGMDISLRTADAEIIDVTNALAPLIAAKDDDMREVFRACLAAVERLEDDVWRPLEAPPPLVHLMRISTQVVSENFAALFAMKRPTIKPTPFSGPAYEPVSMPDGEDWLFRPVLRGCCKAESLFDGTLRIEQLAKLSDALDVADENEARARKAAEKK